MAAENVKSSEGAPVQFLDSLPRASVVEPTLDPVVVPKELEPDPLFAGHCFDAELIRPDSTTRRVRLLRDTGALKSLVCSRVLKESDYEDTDEFRLIRGVTGDVVSVPLVKVALSSPLCQGIYLCGVVATLPDGVAILVGNDIYSDTSAAEVTVVTRSQMVQERLATKQSNTAANDADTSLLTTNTAASSNEDLSLIHI